MENTNNISESSPVQVIISRFFWQNNIALIFLLVLSIGSIMSLLEYTMPNTKSLFSYFSIPIYIITSYGIYKSILFLARMEIEKDYCNQIELSSNDKLLKIRGGNLLMDIKELPSLLPKNDSALSARLFDHIITEANARKFESNLVTLQPYKEESYGGIIEISTLQRIALLLGILGTFIGLVVAFRELNHDNFDIGPVSNALQFSFGTSIAGLETAVILGAFILILRNKQEQLFHIMEKASDSLLSLGRRAINKDDFFIEFDQLKTAILQLSDTVESQNQEVKYQTSQIITGVDRLAAAREDFNGFLNKLSTQEAQFLKEVTQVHHYLSPKVISEELKINLAKSVEEMSSLLATNLNQTLEKYKNINDYILDLNKNLSQIKSNFSKQSEESLTVVSKSKVEIYKILEDLSKSQHDFLEQVSNTHLSEQIKGSISHIKNLEQRIGKYNEINQTEISQRTPFTIISQMLKLIPQFILSICTSLIEGIKSLAKKLKS